jgi:chemotaxis protein methyltransferase CheR
MEENIGKITKFLLHSHGLDLAKYDESFLSKTIQSRRIETHCTSVEAYCTFLEKNETEGKAFSDSLNISYTEFFRNPLTFAVLERIVLPSIVLKKNSKQNEIRIWSAACASGQEAYSLAFLMEERINEVKDKLNYRIFVTDQKESQVSKAKEGKYTTPELNNLNLRRVNRWFDYDGDTYQVKQELKNNFDFSVFDLFNERLGCPPASIFGEFDLVICANVMFYYKLEYQKIILNKMSNCLAGGGYLITGEAERDMILRQNFIEVFPQSAIFQRLERR